METTKKSISVRPASETVRGVPETALSHSLPVSSVPIVPAAQNRPPSTQSASNTKRDAASFQMFQERCRQMAVSLFYHRHAPIRRLGFTSPLGGEGKTLLATLTATALANDSSEVVILVECNWEHPTLHEYYGISLTPGLAEWLRGESGEKDIRHQVSSNLIVIPAGDGKQHAVRLLQQMRQRGSMDMLAGSNELLIVDLPAIATTAYGSLAASLVESVIIVARAGATTEELIKETCLQLKGLPVQGIILNQVRSRIPRWIRQIL